MDALGHANNISYFQYMEQTRSEWIYNLIEGGGPKEDRAAIIVNASCEFLAPLIFPADIEVRMFLADPGRSSVSSFYEIWSGDKKVADGAAKIVWIQLSTGRAVPLPELIVAPLHALAATRSAGSKKK